jgi:hypothetical protein
MYVLLHLYQYYPDIRTESSDMLIGRVSLSRSLSRTRKFHLWTVANGFHENCSPGPRDLFGYQFRVEPTSVEIPFVLGRRALRHFQADPTQENLNAFKRLRARAQRTIREAERTSW